MNKKLAGELSRRRTARPAIRQSKFCHCSYTTVGTSCTTNPQQIEVIELVGYSRQTCNNPRASSHDASTVVGVIHKLDRRRVLYMLRLCYAMVLCSFCLSVSVTNRSVSVTEIAKRIKLVLAWTLPSNYPTLHCKKSRVAPKLRVPTSLWNFVSNSQNFATASRSHCQPNSSTIEFVDHTHDDRRIVAGRT